MPEANLILSDAHALFVKSIYKHVNTPLDQLPYTDAFEVIYRHLLDHSCVVCTRYQLWRWLANARKAKKLPPLRKVGKPGGGNPPVDDGCG